MSSFLVLRVLSCFSVSSNAASCLQIRFAVLVAIGRFSSVYGSPLGLVSEQPHSLNIIVVIGREAMVNTSGQNEQIVLLKSDPDPIITLRSDIEVARTITNVSDLFIFVQMLVEKHFHFGLVDVAHRLLGNCNLIAVLVAALLR